VGRGDQECGGGGGGGGGGCCSTGKEEGRNAFSDLPCPPHPPNSFHPQPPPHLPQFACDTSAPFAPTADMGSSDVHLAPPRWFLDYLEENGVPPPPDFRPPAPYMSAHEYPPPPPPHLLPHMFSGGGQFAPPPHLLHPPSHHHLHPYPTHHHLTPPPPLHPLPWSAQPPWGGWEYQ